LKVSADVGIQCGGARAGPNCVQRYPGDDPDGWVSMQGSAYGEAFGDGDGRLRAAWYSTVLAGDVPGVGRCVMRYVEEPPSTVAIRSVAGTSDPFFPATAEQILHYRMTVVDEEGVAGRELRADRPMRMSATIDAIPPVGTGFVVAEAITFSDVDTGEPVVVLKGGSEGLVLDAEPLDLAVTENDARALGPRLDIDLSVTVASRRLAPAEAGPVWWSVTAHGIDLDDDVVLSQTPPDGSLPLRGALQEDEPGTRMLVIHAFSPGATPDRLQEAHLVRRY
jgi:hypothetical protein